MKWDAVPKGILNEAQRRREVVEVKDMKRGEGGGVRARRRQRHSLGYQMLCALQAVFEPGHSRRQDRLMGRTDVICGIQTMKSMVADVHQFARFIRARWPEVRELRDVRPSMAQEMIEDMVRREVSGGRIGRVSASLRKLDAACRRIGVFAKDAPELLPRTGRGMSFHSDARPIGYTDEEARRIIGFVAGKDPQVARLLELMWIGGLRVSEAAYLRVEDIYEGDCVIRLAGAVNHTKGGRPREVRLAPEHEPFLTGLRAIAEGRIDGHVFASRRSLPGRAREWVRRACSVLGIRPLGTHGLRKTFATDELRRLEERGVGGRRALAVIAGQLGHNRLSVVCQSYIDRKMMMDEAIPKDD